jgi:hypothetical protein
VCWGRLGVLEKWSKAFHDAEAAGGMAIILSVGEK